MTPCILRRVEHHEPRAVQRRHGRERACFVRAKSPLVRGKDTPKLVLASGRDGSGGSERKLLGSSVGRPPHRSSLARRKLMIRFSQKHRLEKPSTKPT